MSQLGADSWVLSIFPNNGFFVDAGCYDGEEISNSFLLEKHGWRGICIDVFPKNFSNRPNTQVVSALLFSASGIPKNFVASIDPTLSGIDETLGYWRNHVLSKEHNIHTMNTRTLSDILDEQNAPSFIEYLSMDIEGCEYDVLSTFPFDRYTFGCITLEHNSEDPKRSLIRDILNNNGYQFVKQVAHDDWYIHNTINISS